MPLYEYRCTQCGYRFEKIQSFNAEPDRECPKCQGALVRPLTVPAFQFKGSGWYVNDYASKSSATTSGSTSAESTAPSEGAAKPAAATESKAAAPAAPAPSSASGPAA